ncbi:ANTH-domain-containing protein [Basidiobolus meristosporus CBS 931.73]|uniref:ANTH-domain-containing protein n=1 Tax=Basidiobolus meristosporus CBS 931.73 TaxID=1314790 RepID=A0A1Y1XYR5_9FUNG|nr:ANTH-domain-containing protein [Basidiobolus meristosporus CBS 931.73]|eukprot:ORX90862.1 ANTH-domain-containing protein [Basidiobolus meristosporus CBS 931.73]
MEKAILKATNRKCVEPKAKHVQTLIAASWSEIDAREIFGPLSSRLHDSSWVTVFKALIVAHRLLRDGCSERLYNQLSVQPGLFNVSGFRDKSGTNEQTKNIRSYAAYIEEKVLIYRETKKDFTQSKNGENSSLRKLTISQGLLKETRLLQRQISTLLNCNFYLDEVNNEVTLSAYCLLIKDLLKLFQCMNEAVINILEHYFEMEKIDARNSLEVYRTFTQLTERVLDYLNTARRIQGALDVNIPTLKHAPVSLALTLEEYLNNPDFENNRRQYLETKKIPQQNLDTSRSVETTASVTRSDTISPTTRLQPQSQPQFQAQPPLNQTATAPVAKAGPEKELIDFFASIEEDPSAFNNTINMSQPFGTINQPPSFGTQQIPFNQQPSQFQVTPQYSNTYQATPQYSNTFQANQFQQAPVTQIPPSSPSNPFQKQFTSQTVRSPTNPFSSQTVLAQNTNLQRSATNPFARMAAQPNPNALAWNLFNQGSSQHPSQGLNLNQNPNMNPNPNPNPNPNQFHPSMNNGFQPQPPNEMQLYRNAFGNA